MIRRLHKSLLLLFLASTAQAKQPVASDRILVAIEGKPLAISAATLLGSERLLRLKPILTPASEPIFGKLTPDANSGFVYRPTAGFFGDDSFTYTIDLSTGVSDPATVFLWTAPRRVAVSGNWDGDPAGLDEFAWLDNHTNEFFLCGGSPKGMECSRFTAPFSLTGLDPLAVDSDGDGFDEIAFFDPQSGTFTITEPYGTLADPTLHPIRRVVIIDAIGKRPLAGDWNGDKIDTFGHYDSTTGVVQLLGAHGPDTAGAYSLLQMPTGGLPFAEDWTEDGRDRVGVYNPKRRELFLDGIGEWTGGRLPTALPIAGWWGPDCPLRVAFYYPNHEVSFFHGNESAPRTLALPGGHANH